jgi:glucosylceramidase
MNVRLPLLFCLALFAALPAPAQDAHLWLTTSDRSAVVAEQPSALHFSSAPTTLPVIDVNDMQQYQTIQGFGYALTGGSAQLLMAMSPAARAALLHELFDPTGDGLHVSYLRVSIGSSDMNDHAYTYDDMPAGQTDPKLAHFSLDIDRPSVIAALKEILAINPHIPILGSPWSAPAWMKTNDKVKDGHLRPEFYSAYAQYFVQYIQGMAAEGINVSAITVQNEPLNPKNTPSMVMFAPEEDTFIAHDLGPAFAHAGIHTGIQVYDHNADVPSYPTSIFADPAANQYVAGAAMHLYGGDASVFSHIHDLYPNKDIFLTEQSVTQRPHSPGLNIDESVQRVVIESTRNWSRNVLLWNLAADPDAGPHTNDGGCASCYGALTLQGDQVTRNLAYYVLAHASKFVPPGSIRVGSNTLEQLDNVAFLTPDGHVVFIVSSTGNFPVHFAIRYHGQIAEATLPSESVGTFVW